MTTKAGRLCLFPFVYVERGLYNTVVLGISFMLLFFAFSTTQSFETNLNGKDGFYSLSVLYVVFAFSNLVAPSVVNGIGERGALFFGAVCYITFIAANIQVYFATLIAASAIVGFGAAVLWSAQGAVVTHSAPTGKLGAYNGIFFGIFQWASVLGNLLAGVLLSIGLAKKDLFIILTFVGATSLFGFAFIRKMNVVEEEVAKPSMSFGARIASTVYHAIDVKMIYMYLPMIYSGVSQTFMFGIFPGTLETKEVGYVMAAFGLADAAGSLAAGYLSDKVGRVPVVVTAALCMSGGSTLMLLRHLGVIHTSTPLLYGIAVLLGLSDSGFNTQIYATLGAMFADTAEAAFAAFKFFQAGATAILFFLGSRVSLFPLFVVTNASLWGGVITYSILTLVVLRRATAYQPINAT